MQNMMGAYVEQSRNMFQQMQENMQEQSRKMFSGLQFPNFGAGPQSEKTGEKK
jgi:polyhydroxyalkanoate synthesis regulator protein